MIDAKIATLSQFRCHCSSGDLIVHHLKVSKPAPSHFIHPSRLLSIRLIHYLLGIFYQPTDVSADGEKIPCCIADKTGVWHSASLTAVSWRRADLPGHLLELIKCFLLNFVIHWIMASFTLWLHRLDIYIHSQPDIMLYILRHEYTPTIQCLRHYIMRISVPLSLLV